MLKRNKISPTTNMLINILSLIYKAPFSVIQHLFESKKCVFILINYKKLANYIIENYNFLVKY